MKRRGLASASPETRKRVSQKGGQAPHPNGKGLAVASSETRKRVGLAGGKSRALDKAGLVTAGVKGGEIILKKYGPGFYSRIGKKGGHAVHARRGSEFYSEIGKRGGETVKRERGSEYYSAIGKIGATAEGNSNRKKDSSSLLSSSLPPPATHRYLNGYAYCKRCEEWVPRKGIMYLPAPRYNDKIARCPKCKQTLRLNPKREQTKKMVREVNGGTWKRY